MVAGVVGWSTCVVKHGGDLQPCGTICNQDTYNSARHMTAGTHCRIIPIHQALQRGGGDGGGDGASDDGHANNIPGGGSTAAQRPTEELKVVCCIPATMHGVVHGVVQLC